MEQKSIKTYDIIIIGGGHAGIEACNSACQYKDVSVALITMPGVAIGSAPCNPAVGGVGKGQVVREIDALGGIMGFFADKAGIQYRTLNDSKGYAVKSTRVQIDKDLYSQYTTEYLAKIPNLHIYFEKVNHVKKVFDGSFIIESENLKIISRKVVVTVGTFLRGKLHLGEMTKNGGRWDNECSESMQDIFSQVKTSPKRFKTGTPPRLNILSLDFTVMEEQPSDSSVRNFSYKNQLKPRNLDQVSCYLTRTNQETIDIITANKEKSPMFNGQINATGARYCPSIEDKAFRYPHKSDHHIFVEPEGLNLNTVYPSGISSSLPSDVQLAFLQTIKGLEKCQVEKYGYAVEYDVVDTTELSKTLEYKEFEGLYFAGQVNGTSGYEEAAGQGLIAGFNAALSLKLKNPLILDRNDSYIGVMIEDLVSNTRDEPYRLFTARSENRLYIREDNSNIRMSKYRKQLGLSSEIDKYNEFFCEFTKILSDICDDLYISPEDEFLATTFIEIPRRISLSELMKQAKLDPVQVFAAYLDFHAISVPRDVLECVAISKKYEGYINKANSSYEKVGKLDKRQIDWEKLCKSRNISFECKQRIQKIRPETFGQLKLIEGIRPATLAVVAGEGY